MDETESHDVAPPDPPTFIASRTGKLGVALAAGLLVSRLGSDWWIRRDRENQRHWLVFAKSAGLLILSAAAIWADGGPESLFVFWYFVLLGLQVLVQRVRPFMLLSGVGVLAYAGFVVVPYFTAAGVGRLALLVVYCWVLTAGRRRFETQVSIAQRGMHAFEQAFWLAPLAMAVVEGEPIRPTRTNRRGSDLVRLLWDSRETGILAEVETLVGVARDNGGTAGPLVVKLNTENRYLRVLATSRGPDDDSGAVLCAEDVTQQVTAGEARQAFLQLASHQLRTPLTPIIGYAEMLGDGTLARSEVQEAAGTILAEARRLERLFERMAAVVRLRQESDRETIDTTASAVLGQLAESSPQLMDGVELRGNPETSIGCDPESLAAALRELIDNSHRFGVPPISLTWQERQGGLVEFAITDAGSGPELQLDPEDLFGGWGTGSGIDRMPRGMGTRLGLLQARLLVGLSGGELGFRREEAESWAFTVTLVASSGGAGPNGKVSTASEGADRHEENLVSAHS